MVLVNNRHALPAKYFFKKLIDFRTELLGHGTKQAQGVLSSDRAAQGARFAATRPATAALAFDLRCVLTRVVGRFLSKFVG